MTVNNKVIRAQQIRLKRFHMSVATFVVVLLSTVLITSLGLGNMSGIQWTFFIGLGLLGLIVFFIMFYTSLNLYFTEPSLTREQIVFWSFWGLFAMYWLPDARPIIFIFYLAPFSFGILILTFRQYFSVVGYVMGLFVLLLGLEYFEKPEDFNFQYQLFLFALFGIYLTWFAVFGGFVSKIRQRLRQEIYERKCADDALRESEEKYKHLVKNAPSGIYEIDFEKMKFTTVNDIMCRYTGYSEEELLFMNPFDFLAEKSKNRFIKELKNYSTKKKVISSVEHDIIKKDGEHLKVVLNNDYIYKNGKLKGARVVVHDITDLKMAEEEKIKAQKIAGEQSKMALVGQIAGKMAHDFNNILGIIMGNAELSLMDCEEEETKKTLELIFKQTQRGKNLTKNLVAFAKAQEPRQEFFGVNEKIDLVLNLLTKDLDGIEVVVEKEPDVFELFADPGMIEHALVNLIQNSIHATSLSDSPKIIIRVFCFKEYLCLEIEDNGCGIPKEHLETIYEPAFTLKGSKDVSGCYKAGIRGTGYGMSNVKKYIEQHKGTILVNSEYGSGTKITIHLLIFQKELTCQEKAELQKEKICSDQYILLVEDEQSLSSIQHRILTQAPYCHRVDIADNGRAAMNLFQKNKYDLVSLDYILPGNINGMDVYDHIRSIHKTIPILFISGNIEFLESIKMLKQKDTHVDHLSKPCQNKEYVDSINKLFKRALAELRE